MGGAAGLGTIVQGCFKRAINLFAFAAVLLPIVAHAVDAPTTAPVSLPTIEQIIAAAPRFNVHGKVVDATGKGIEAAEVVLYLSCGDAGDLDAIVGKTRSGADGGFRFESAAYWPPEAAAGRANGARYYVLATDPSRGLAFTAIEQGGPTQDIVVRMGQKRTTTVTVVDSAGHPIEGAQVHLFIWQTQPTTQPNQSDQSEEQPQMIRLWKAIPPLAGKTGSDGKVELLSLAGSDNFIAEKDGFAPAAGDARIELRRSAKLSGKVTQPDGSPAPGVAVQYGFEQGGPGLLSVVFTDAQGNYEFANAPAIEKPGGSWLNALSGGLIGSKEPVATLKVRDYRPGSPFYSTAIEFSLLSGKQQTRDISLQRGCLVAGKIVNLTDGQPVPSFKLNGYVQSGNNGYESVVCRSSADGRFQLTVPPGAPFMLQWDRSQDRYLIDQQWLNRDYRNYQPLQQQMIKSDRTDLVLKVKLVPTGLLNGTVVDEAGKPVAQAQVHFIAEVRPAITDAAGAFVMAAAPRDRDFDLCVQTGDKKLGAIAHLTKGSTQATITLRPTKDWPGLAMTPDGLPAADLSFSVDPFLAGQANYQLRQEVKTDADGKYTLRHLIDGATYQAFWNADNERNRDYDSNTAKIDLSTLKEGEPIRFEAKQYLNALMGTVVNEKDEPIAGARIDPGGSELLPQDARYNGKSITTNKSGQFEIPRLAAGKIILRISAKGYRIGSFQTATDDIGLKAVLKPRTTVSGLQIEVVDEAGKPIADAPVVLWEQKYSLTGKATQQATTRPTDAAGHASFDVPAAMEQRRSQRIIICNLPGRGVAIRTLTPDDDEVHLAVKQGDKALKGIVIDEAGNPVVGAAVRITWAQLDSADRQGYVSFTEEMTDELLRLSCHTDQAGKFELPTWGRGRLSISISAPGKVLEQTSYDLDSQDPSSEPNSVTLTAGGTVRGRVVFDPSPAALPAPEPAVRVYFIGPDGNRSTPPVPLSSDWTFSADVAPGSYTAAIHIAPDQKEIRKYVCVERPPLEVAVGKTAEVVVRLVPGIPLHGKLVSASRIEEAIVLATSSADRFGGASAQVQKDGTWELYLPREDSYQIRYYIPGTQQYQMFKTIKVQRDPAPEELVIQVDSKVQ